jgi:hypothetical protein
MGYKKGGGEWRGTDLFAPKPIRLPYDAEIVTEVEILRNKLKGERNEGKRGAHERRMEFGRAVLGMNGA